jgi:lipoprotein Spr
MKKTLLLLFMSLLAIFLSTCKHKKKAVAKKPVAKTETKTKPEVQSGTIATTTKGSGSKGGTHDDVLRQKLGVSEKEINNSKLLLFVSDWYGVPYKYGGCQKTGIDCSCFTNLLCDKVYNVKMARSASDMYKGCNKVTPDEMKEGDLVFFKIDGNSISHVGVYLRNKMFVHSSTSKGVIINSMDEAYYKKFFHAGGRIKNS